MEIHFVTAFPEMFNSPFNESILKRAQDKGLINIKTHDLRNWTTDNHKTLDDKPYGGGAGMVMLLEPIYKAIKDIKASIGNKKTIVILTSAKGDLFNQNQARDLSQYEVIIFICGHYEGIDERVAENISDLEISIGKYVLTGGELPAMVITDAIVRLIPGVLGNEGSLLTESYTLGNELEAPHYTRPAKFISDDNQEWNVPDVLLSGNHKEIETWRKSREY